MTCVEDIRSTVRQRMLRPVLLLCIGVVLMGCDGQSARSLLPSHVPLIDINPDPAITEVRLIASPARKEYLPGKIADVWAYRDGARSDSVGTVPGPMLQARVGEQVIVHFQNDLPAPTTVHWHGLRVPNAHDGSMSSQHEIPSGGTYDYRFVVQDAGSFWYHPHINAPEQVEKGLYAPLIVQGDPAISVAAERYLVLDDVKLLGSGKLDEAVDPLDIMLGRPGNVLLVNGMREGRIEVPRGSRERWRLVNVANGRYFNLRLPGHRFYVIGWDGGLLPIPYVTETLLIAPGERYDVLVTFESPPEGHLALQNVFYDRGHNLQDPGPKDLIEVVYGPAGPPPAALPTVLRIPSSVSVHRNTPVRPFVLKEIEDPVSGATFQINGERWPMNTPLHVTRGSTEIWEIEANPEMDHPFHLHGMFFQVLSVDGVPPSVQWGWKDTVNVQRGRKLRLAVQYDPPGTWMFHCHILEHAERGMMGELVID